MRWKHEKKERGKKDRNVQLDTKFVHADQNRRFRRETNEVIASIKWLLLFVFNRCNVICFVHIAPRRPLLIWLEWFWQFPLGATYIKPHNIECFSWVKWAFREKKIHMDVPWQTIVFYDLLALCQRYMLDDEHTFVYF